MTKTILVCGHGPGISDAVAHQFGAQGFAVGLVARSKDKLVNAAVALTKKGIRAEAFPADLSDPKAIAGLVSKAKSSLGPIAAIHWNAYSGAAGDLLTAKPEEVRGSFDLGVLSLLAAVQETLPDLKAQKGGVLITGGGFSFYDPKVDAAATAWNAAGLALTKAAQHKLAGLLHERLKKEGVYVGEVVVLGMVKGTAFDSGNATLEPKAIAEKFWELYKDRAVATTNFG
ncbi:MAG: SDR family NAD(P)-dependent oxidoreductase [Myxococcota bacterium]